MSISEIGECKRCKKLLPYAFLNRLKGIEVICDDCMRAHNVAIAEKICKACKQKIPTQAAKSSLD